MNPELKALIDEARQRGASMTEIRSIMEDYYGLKKKEEQEQIPLIATFPSTSEMGSLDSKEVSLLEGREGPSFSDLVSRPRIGEAYVPDYQADLLISYADNVENSFNQLFYDRFDMDKYRQLVEYNGGATEEEMAFIDNYNAAKTEDEKYAVKSSVVDYLSEQSDADYDFNRYLVGAIDDGVFQHLTGNPEVEGEYEMKPVSLSAPMSKAIRGLGNEVSKVEGARLKELLPDDIKNDPESLMNYERYLLDEYGLAVDLNSDTYIGGYEFLKEGGSSGFGTSVAKAWHEAMAGGKLLLGDSFASMFGEDNFFSRWAVESGEESRKMAEEAMSRLPYSLNSYSEKTDNLIASLGRARQMGGGIPFEQLDDWVDESLRLGGASAPMMGAAITAGLITRGKSMKGMGLGSLKGLKGAERVAATRKIIEANKNLRAVRSTNLFGAAQKTTTGARITKQAGRAQNLGALGATTAMGIASTYNSVRDEDWFQEMNGFEKAGYTSAMGFLEGAPAFVGAAIATSVLRAGGRAATESFARGMLKAVGFGAIEEGMTEATTAAGQYYLNSLANPNVDFTMDGLWDATKEGWYAGVVLGAGVAGTASIPAGVRAGAMALTSIPGLRDSIEINKLAKEYELAPTMKLRQEIGVKINNAVMKAWDKRLGRKKFYESLQQSNPEAFQKLEQIQKQIARLGIEYGRSQDPEARNSLKEKIVGLIDQRTKQETDLGLEYELNAESEFNRVARGISRIDKKYNGYGDLFQGGADSVTVTSENVDSVMDAINSTTFDGTPMPESGVFKSGSQMRRAMANVVSVVKSLSKTGKFSGVTIHKTADSFLSATGQTTLTRGMWSGKGEIHLFAPAIMENTGFHEAYHDLVLEAIGPEGVQQLADRLLSALPADAIGKYERFISQYGDVRNIRKAIKNNVDVAEEFLVELLADITTGDLDVAVKKGLINSFKGFVGSTLNTIPGVNVDMVDADPKIQDLVNALQKVTGQLAEGEAVTGTKDLREAAIRAGYNAMMIELEDMNPKAQGIYARNRDVEEVTDAARFAGAMAEATERMKQLKKKMFLQVDPLTTEDAQKILDDGGKLFMTKDGLSGAYVKADGYMGGLFKNPDSELKLVSNPLQTARAKNGGKFYDAFATELESLYIGNGWRPVARLDFNPEFAPEGWDDADSPLKTQPDVVFFVRGEGNIGDGVRMTDYMEAYEYAERIANGKPQAIIKSLEEKPGRDSYLEKQQVTEEQLEQRRDELKLDESQRQKRSPKVVKALQDYVAQEITQEQYIEVVREETPITPFVYVPEVPSTLDIGAALTSNKLESGIIGLNKEIPEGYYVGLRLDIPAYDNYDVWVVSVHQGARGEERAPNLGGKSIGYGQTALATNVEFHSVPKGALNIALEKGKTTIARMFGDWNNHDPQQLRDRAEEIMNSDQYNMSDLAEGKLDGWIQVGMNPFRHSWFYDKRDGNPVVSASEVIQIGALVLAKDVEKVSTSDERFTVVRKDGTPMKFQHALPGESGVDTRRMMTNKAQRAGLLSTKYAEDDKEFKRLMAESVVHNQDPDELLMDRVIMTSSPDNLMVGSLYFDDELVFEGAGGMYYPVRTGNMWAFADLKEARVVAEKLNALRKASPDGKVFFMLMAGRPEKVFSNTGAVATTELILRKLMAQGLLTDVAFNRIVIESFKQTFPKNRPVRIDGSTLDAANRILSFMTDVKASDFGKRKYFTDKMLVNIGIAFADNQAGRDGIQKMLETDKIGAKQTGSTLKRIIARLLTERFLVDIDTGSAYAAIEIDSDVTFGEDAEASPIFPASVFQLDENGNKKPVTMHLFKKKVKPDEVFPLAKDILTTERGFRKKEFIETFSSKYEGRQKKDGTFKDPIKAAESAWNALLGLLNQPYGVARYKGKAQAIVDAEAKAQGNITRLVSQMIDAKYPSPKITRDKRRKNPVTSIDESMQLDAFVHVKADVIKTLMDYGFTKEGAERMFKEAVAYKQGRTQGKREGMRVAMMNAKEASKLSTKAKNLKKSLEELRDKSKTFKEFLSEAINLIDERMKEDSKTPFTRGQLKDLVKYIRQAHNVNAKRASEEGLDAMQSFIDKISVIFDKREAKAEMQKYLEGVRHARNLQARLKRMSKVRGRASAPKNVTTYAKVANGLAAINPALLPQNELESFVGTLMQTISSMSKSKAVFDAEEERYAGISFDKTRVEVLRSKLSSYSAMEEIGRQSLFMAKAQVRAAKNKTSIEEEYDKLVKNYERSRLSSSRRAILDFIDDNPTITHPETGEQVVLDESNPAHVDLVTQILAENAALKEELQKDAIIYDVLIPRIAANLTKLLEDSQIADILGLYNEGEFDVNKLALRLQKLKRHHIINLDYRLDDYVVNDSVYGIGYMHALVKGNIDMPNALSKLVRSKNLKSRSGVLSGPLDTINSYIQNLIPADRITTAKLRVAFGLSAMTTNFAKADFIHTQIVEMLESEIDRIESEGGSVKTRADRAIAQMYSMARQLPKFEGEKGGAEAAWYIELRNAMRRSIDYYVEQKTFEQNEIDEFEDAFNYLFGAAETLPEMIQRVESERSDITGLVDYMSDIHSSLMPQFRNYVERYLGKELELEDNYTAFEVIPETGARNVDDLIRMRVSISEALASSSLSHTKKVAGSSFERNPRSLKGKNRIGLDFLSINERTLRDNIILSNTVGDVVAANYVMNSDAMKNFIVDAKARKELERKMMLYVQQDTGKVPPVFQPTFRVRGVKFMNPVNLLRNAVIVKAFGSFGIQTLKQSTVLTSVMFQTNNPIQSIPYLIKTVSEMAVFSLRTLAREDSKLALDDGRYKLLQNSPVFQRDYEAGNIDPYTGRMSLDEGKLQEIVRKLSDISLKNLKGTDKVAAVASWFTFYGDALMTEGAIESFDEIDWDAEAANPNEIALSYADMMVNKDQAASTPREAADLYQQEKGSKAVVTYLAQNVLLPFSRFAVNKKRSISSDFMRILYGDAQAKREGSTAMLGHAAELTLFSYVGKVLIPAISAMLRGDDEDELPKDNAWRQIATQVIVDAQPLPPLGVFDKQIQSTLNRYLWYPTDVMREGDFNLGDDDGYERWTRLNKGVPLYYKGAPKDATQGLLRFMGPYGDFIDDARTTIHNLSMPENKVVSSTGTEFYVRPEDKEAMMMHYYLKIFLTAGQVAGLSSKEIDVLVRDMDNLPKDRRLSNEEALAAYESIAEKYGRTLGEGEGEDRLREIAAKADNPFDKVRAVNSFKSSIKPIVAEKNMEEQYPDQHRKYIREVRKLPMQLKNARDYYAFMRSKRQTMSPEEYIEFKTYTDMYLALVRPAFYTEGQYIESKEE